MLTIEQINQEMMSPRFASMTSEGSSSMKQALTVLQAMMLQVSMGQALGVSGANMMTAIGSAFLLGMLAERDGWCLDEHVESE